MTTRVFLGLTVGCAQCHDHKYDPIPTKDYYSLLGVFQYLLGALTAPLVGAAGTGTAVPMAVLMLVLSLGAALSLRLVPGRY